MSYFYKAEERPTEYYFEICPGDSKCTCSDTTVHHIYHYGNDVDRMSLEDMVREVELHETSLAARKLSWSLPVHGNTLMNGG